MTDILLLALAIDRDRAGAIADDLVERRVAGQYRVQFFGRNPTDLGWAEVVAAARDCPCVIFCWSSATDVEHAEPYRRLAVKTLAAGHAISVELDKNALPPELGASTTYPLYGWRARPKGFLRLVFGNGFVTQIVAAAEEKVIGRDPPPANAFWRLVRRQAWITLGTIAFVLGIAATLLGFYRDPDLAKLRDRSAEADFLAAKKSASCDALDAFVKKHTGSAWSADASELRSTCKERDVTVYRLVEQLEVVSAGTSGAIARTLEPDAYRDATARAQAKGERLCKAEAEQWSAELKGVRLTDVWDKQCSTTSDGIVCTFMANARCTLKQPFTERKVVMGGATSDPP